MLGFTIDVVGSGFMIALLKNCSNFYTPMCTYNFHYSDIMSQIKLNSRHNVIRTYLYLHKKCKISEENPNSSYLTYIKKHYFLTSSQQKSNLFRN